VLSLLCNFPGYILWAGSLEVICCACKWVGTHICRLFLEREGCAEYELLGESVFYLTGLPWTLLNVVAIKIVAMCSILRLRWRRQADGFIASLSLNKLIYSRRINEDIMERTLFPEGGILVSWFVEDGVVDRLSRNHYRPLFLAFQFFSLHCGRKYTFVSSSDIECLCWQRTKSLWR